MSLILKSAQVKQTKNDLIWKERNDNLKTKIRIANK